MQINLKEIILQSMNNNILINIHMQDKPAKLFLFLFLINCTLIKTSLTIIIFSTFFLALTIGIFTSYKLGSDKNRIINYIDNNPTILSQKVYAQTSINSKTNNNTIPPIPKTASTTNVNETTILKEGILSSSKSLPNETSQVAIILPHRADGKIYSGFLTYSATSPVEIGLLHRISVDNNTLSLIKSIYGKSAPHWIDYASAKHHLNETAIQIIAGFRPNYGTSTPYFSASIPFVASSVGLWSPTDTPFLVSYQVSAKTAQPDIVNDINNSSTK